MSKFHIILTTGIAMFAMFFGSGNLIFPLKIGMQVADKYVLASIGLIITGVLVPFLGLFSMIVYQGDKEKYFGLLGNWAPFTLSLIMLSLLGPFGVVPRCVIVAYGGISVLWPELSFSIFSLLFCLAILAIIWHETSFIPIIGKCLAPIKIAGIIIIIIASLYHHPNLISNNSSNSPILIGLTEGYQTMDLLAAFFFSITIIKYINTLYFTKEECIKISLYASIIGASLIAIIYICFIILGSYYAPDLAKIKPEQYLGTIANISLGNYGAFLFSLTMFVACLTTAASLSRLFAEFLQHDLAKGRISWSFSILITIGLSFLISLTGFSNITRFLGVILNYIYPALIILSITSIPFKYEKFKSIKKSFWISIALAITYKIISI